MAISELELTLIEIISQVVLAQQDIADLQGETGETNGVRFGTNLPAIAPEEMAPNELFCLTSDFTGGPGGTLYRYDSGIGQWLRIS